MTLNGQTFQSKAAFFVPTEQRQYRLIRGIFERSTQFQDSIFYDISAWTLPDAFGVHFGELVVHVANDRHGIVRIGVGCESVSMVDESAVAREVLSAVASIPGSTWADLSFGLNIVPAPLSSCSLQALQLSIFMVPGWNIYNLGLSSPQVTLSDLAPIFKLLKFL